MAMVIITMFIIIAIMVIIITIMVTIITIMVIIITIMDIIITIIAGQPGKIPNDGEDDDWDDIDGAGKGSNLFELMII